MTRNREEAFNNLKLDMGFFNKMIRLDGNAVEDGQQDFDVYLMENGVMPLLLQGLDALSRHVDKMAASGSTRVSKVPFNPLTWLAQYLLRNHPGKVRDHRTPMYKQLGKMASIERGRRSLLRRKAEIEGDWYEMENVFRLEDIPGFLQHLDAKWLLDGAFVTKCPRSFDGLIELAPDKAQVDFDDFWQWFEKYVGQNDIIRAPDFDEAIRRKESVERQEREVREKAIKGARAMREILEQQRGLAEQFASISADMYTDDAIAKIINKGATIVGHHYTDLPLDDVVPEGQVSYHGDHIELLVNVLKIWGCPVLVDEDPRIFGPGAFAAWQSWVELHGPEGANKREVNSTSLKKLIDTDVYQEYLKEAYPTKDLDEDGDDDITMEVTAILGDDEGEEDVLVEAVDDVTGETMQLRLPAKEVDEVRRRLETGNGGQPLYAQVNRITNQVTEVHPEPKDSDRREDALGESSFEEGDDYIPVYEDDGEDD